jgi:hypothetical protein
MRLSSLATSAHVLDQMKQSAKLSNASTQKMDSPNTDCIQWKSRPLITGHGVWRLTVELSHLRSKDVKKDKNMNPLKQTWKSAGRFLNSKQKKKGKMN